MGERLHKVLVQIGSELWFPWQQKAPIGLPVGFLLLRDSVLCTVCPYLCFISFLYLDLYVLGDDAWIS